MLTCAVAISAQEVRSEQQTAKSQTQKPAVADLPSAVVKEALPNGSYLVAIEGRTYKAIDEPTIRGILQDREDLDKSKRARVALEKQIALYEQNLTALHALVKIADDQTAEEIRIAGNYKLLYDGEHDLRLKAEKLYASPGRVASFFQNPIVQIAEKIGKPIFESWLASRGRQTTVVMTSDQVALLRTQQLGVQPYIVQRR